MHKAATILCLALLLAAGARAAENVDPLAAIHQDFVDGELTLDQKTLLVIDAIKNPQKLPDRYRSRDLAAASGFIGKCPTPYLMEIRSNWEDLSLSTQQTFLSAFVRATAEFTVLSPSGFFKLHYDTLGEDAVPSEDSDSSGVPDFVELCAEYLDTSLTTHELYSWRMPPSDGGLGGDSLFDVYFEETGYYGYAIPEGPGPEPWWDSYSYLVLNNDFLGFPSNDDPEGDVAGAAKVTCAHEFHHCIQFAYDSGEDQWFAEMDATTMEDIVYDQVNDNYQYLGTFFNAPERSLLEVGDHAYSTFPWGLFLAEKFDTSLVERIWDGARYNGTVFGAMGDTLEARHGWTLDSAFTEFCVWNYATGVRYDSLHYSENFPYDVQIGRFHWTYPVPAQSSPSNPAGYGSCYIEFYPSGAPGKLKLTINGSDTREWKALVVKSTADDVLDVEQIPLAPANWVGTIEIPDFDSLYRVTLVVANTEEYSSGSFFSYSAEIIPPYEVASAVLTLDSAVYSGGVRNFEYLISNAAPIADILDVTAWDDAGWAPSDTFSFSLAPNGDSLVHIPISPPQGTPLDEVSTMWFKVSSRGNPAIVDSQAVAAATRLQRGDVNFEGSVVVSDLTYLVDFLFRGGPEPLPVAESGDFSCDGPVNVTDLTEMVEYLFKGGGEPACNPY